MLEDFKQTALLFGDVETINTSKKIYKWTDAHDSEQDTGVIQLMTLFQNKHLCKGKVGVWTGLTYFLKAGTVFFCIWLNTVSKLEL